MELTLADQQLEIQKQKELLELSMETRTTENTKQRADDDLEDMQDQLKDLENQKKQLDEDRKNFTDAAIKLGLERAALQVLSMLSSTKEHSSKIKKDS